MINDQPLDEAPADLPMLSQLFAPKPKVPKVK